MTDILDTLAADGRYIATLTDSRTANREFEEWVERVAQWLRQEHPGTGLSAEWSGVSISPLKYGEHFGNSRMEWMRFGEAVRKRLEWLGAKAGKQKKPPQAVQGTPQSNTVLSKQVFVVHGHDEATKEKVARFISKLRLEPMILHEQPNRGRTIIEKFVDHADVGYALVLLTADDVGGPKRTDGDNMKSRARQNVVFELGYFTGRLGRERVCALYEGGVEIPSDYEGVVYVPLDEAGAWQFKVAKELKAAGFDTDMNDAI
jgi:predicted nucleotide-binding protein